MKLIRLFKKDTNATIRISKAIKDKLDEMGISVQQIVDGYIVENIDLTKLEEEK